MNNPGAQRKGWRPLIQHSQENECKYRSFFDLEREMFKQKSIGNIVNVKNIRS